MLNKNHPDYLIYKKKFEMIWSEQEREIEMWEESHSDEKMKDETYGGIYKKYAKKIKELQNEYAHLFE